jgi:hypothetical protein
VEAGRQSHKNDTESTGSKQSGGSGSGGSSGGSSSGSSTGSKQSSSSGTRGGTHEQHVEAGRQSHKNDG